MQVDQRKGAREATENLVRCGQCSHFSFFPNEKGHNRPQALGRCLAGASWDGNRGQWPLLLHPCPNFNEKS